MNITVNARHMDVTDTLKQYAEEKASKLPKFYDNIQSIEVILDQDGDQKTVEIIVQAPPRSTLVAHENHQEDMYAGVDKCIDKMSEQLRRHKEKLRNHKGATPTGELEQP